MLKKSFKGVNLKEFGYKVFQISFLFTLSILFFLSLISYDEFDPSPFSVGEDEVNNYLGIFGANISAILFFIFGDLVWLIIVGFLFLSRLIAVLQYKKAHLLLRIIFILVLSFILSLSTELISLNSGVLGKAFLIKIKDFLMLYGIEDFYINILLISLILFALVFLLNLSKSYRSFFSFTYKAILVTLKFNLNIFKYFFIRKIKIEKKKANTKKIKVLSQLYTLPTLDFLEWRKASSFKKADNTNQNAKQLEKVLEDYGVKGEIVNVTLGPVVTRYELEPAPGTRSSRVISLSDDIARSMSAKSARVAVIYGKNAIGIELPNKNIEKVFLKEIIGSTSFVKKDGIYLALGKDIAGKPIVTDLSKMPHLLIAGTTGSGKSVSINAMILSLLYNFNPKECKLILIDPKMLELSVYEDIPHLLHPVVTDPRKAVFALKWAVREMNERYKQMSSLGVRNIESYNKIISKRENKQETILKKVQVGFDNATGKPIYQEKEIALKLLPFLVIIVDEMADLMLAAGKEIEVSIQSLAQKARAAGIHLVLATQRPSVDVITGTIKANLPYRISFQVTSKIDSRTILGEQGAEQLLGKGDMLFMAGGGYTERVHGPLVNDQEIARVTDFIKNQGLPEYQHHITEDINNNDEEHKNIQEENDPLYEKALTLIIKEKKVSTSFLQRHFAIGYNRAARIVDAFEKRGIVSSPNSMGRREVMVNRND
jgi:S-DNA-T family DNA segregation ATPase FtsK/SpoIIIE